MTVDLEKALDHIPQEVICWTPIKLNVEKCIASAGEDNNQKVGLCFKPPTPHHSARSLISYILLCGSLGGYLC